jgi:transposase
MRKGFNGLEALVSERLKESAQSGALFLFTNRKRTRLKVLYWDGSGLWVLSKRLEQGRFSWPKSTDPDAVKLRLRPEAFALLSDGVEMKGAKFLPWYERPE